MPDVLEQHVVTEEGLRLDRWAAAAFERIGSRSAAQKKISAGRLLLDGEKVENSRFVRLGQTIVLLADPAVPACDVPLEVLFADDHCAIVVKPAGLLTSGNRHRTFENALPNVLGPVTGTTALVRPRPVHRLDYETTGPVAVARTQQAVMRWSEAFQQREVHKRYQAIVLGRLTEPTIVETPLDGRSACSRVTPMHAFRSMKTQWCTWVELEPVTGRTHQLRRHLLELGHPVLGDRLHANGPAYRGKGLFLASTHLRLPHPVTGEPVEGRASVPSKFHSFQVREERRVTAWESR